MARVLLYNAPSAHPGKVLNKFGRWIPGEQLGICYLAAVLRRDGHYVEVRDGFMGGLSAAEAAAEVSERSDEFDVVGLSVSDGKVEGCIDTLNRLEELPRSVHLTLGGHTATLCAPEFLTQFARLDSVVRGEGEAPLAHLCRLLDDGGSWRQTPGLCFRADGAIRENPALAMEFELDRLPFPARDNLSHCLEVGFSASIESSRGCKGVCSFCATRMMFQPRLGRIWRSRSVGNVVDEIEILVHEHGVKELCFEDEDFLGWGDDDGHDRAVAIGRELRRRGIDIKWAALTRVDNVNREVLNELREAGLAFLFVGVESGSQKVLRKFKKETSVDQNLAAMRVLQDLDIGHEHLFIMYGPDTTLDDVEANLDYLDQLEALNINLVDCMRVYHGTPMHARLQREGRLAGNWVKYSYEFPDQRVNRFKAIADRGINAFLQVISHMDALRLRIRCGHPLDRVLRIVDRRLHVGASDWLRGLLDSVRTGTEDESMIDGAVREATNSAEMFKRLVETWPRQPAQDQGGSCS